MTRNRRHRGAAGGWIILLVVLAVLAALVGWKMVSEHGRAKDSPTTMPSPR